jgi:Type IV secretion system pilin
MKKYLAHIPSLVLLTVLSSQVVHAQNVSTCPTGVLCNPLTTGDTLVSFLQAIVQNIVLPVGAVIAVLSFIFTGFLYVVAQGKPAEIEKANRSLLYTSIGTALLLGAWTIATVVQNTVQSVTR